MLMILVTPTIICAQGFHYPTPPDSLCNRQERIVYIVEHFWNDQNIADTASFKSPKLLLDYLYLLEQISDEEKNKYIDSFISLASNHHETFNVLLWLLDNILYNSVSPFYDEETYLKMLNVIIATDIDSTLKLLPKERLRIIKKNRVGKYANDFTFIDKQGQKHRLYEIKTPFLLLVFNNPDCSFCHQIEKKINNNIIIQQLLMNDSLKILAITPAAEYNKWLEHQYPKEWDVGFDIDKTIETSRLYDIQRFPSIYLLDRDKRVLLKEADYERLCKYLTLK